MRVIPKSNKKLDFLFTLLVVVACSSIIFVELFSQNTDTKLQSVIYIVKVIRDITLWSFGALYLSTAIIYFRVAKTKLIGLGNLALANGFFIVWALILYSGHIKFEKINAALKDNNEIYAPMLAKYPEVFLTDIKDPQQRVRLSHSFAESVYFNGGKIIEVYRLNGETELFEPSPKDIELRQSKLNSSAAITEQSASLLAGCKHTSVIYLLSLLLAFGYNRIASKRWL